MLKKYSTKQTIIYSSLIIFSFFALLEITARAIEIWIPPATIDIGLGFNPDSRLYIQDKKRPGFLKTNPEKLSAFHGTQFTVPKPTHIVRIFFLGGSSVYHLSLNKQMNILQSILADRLGKQFTDFEIINAGGKSYGSQRLVPIVTEILNYQPDLILLYSGHNEFEELEQLELVSLKTNNIQKIMSKFAFLRFVRDRIAGIRIAKMQKDHNNRLLSKASVNYARAWRHKFTKKEAKERMAAYENNLTHIILLCRKNKVPLVVGTVPSNLLKPYLSQEVWQDYLQVLTLINARNFEKAERLGRKILKNTPTRHQASDLENSIIKKLSQRYDIFLADVEKAVNDAEPHSFPGLTLFADHCHLNKKGNEILLNTFAQATIQVLEQSAPASSL